MPIIAKESVLYNWLGYLDVRLTDAIDDTSDSGLESVIGLLDVLAGDTPPESGNTPPVAVDDTDVFSVEQGETVTINATQLLENDSDADADDHLTIVAVSNPDTSDGTAVLSADGTFITFNAEAGYSGPASFDYVVYDGEDTATASVTGIVTEGGGGGGGTETVAIDATTAAAGALDASGADYIFEVSGDATYTQEITGFDAGDVLDFPADNDPTVNNVDFTDGMVDVQYAYNGNVSIVELTGLDPAVDMQLLGIQSFDNVFGEGTII
jgi:hypothetical protein